MNISSNTPVAMQDDHEIERKEITTDEGTYTLVLYRRDLSSLYPGMILYTLRLLFGDRLLALFRTNSYEYSPGSSLNPETAVREKEAEWEDSIKTNPLEFFSTHLEEVHQPPDESGPDVLILQGSPRADGNSSIMATWALEAAESYGQTAEVVFVHDLMIRPCIGCYQCYNTGFCTFHDDMAKIIASIRHAGLMVICTPVYTSTVPAGLKLVIDRFQAYHAEMILLDKVQEKKGLLLSVSGRPGKENFTCVTRVVGDFMANLHIVPSGNILIDGLDRLQDVRMITGIEKKIKDLVMKTLSGQE
jgi:multimeric flavodoxin WrbA